MSRAVKVQGIECPIIREGDNILDIVVESVLKEVLIKGKSDESLIEVNPYTHLPVKDVYERLFDSLDTYNIQDKSVIGITESVVARSAGQYITVDDIAKDVKKKFGKDSTICLINPIYSRNRFAMILKGIARAAKKVIIVMPDYDEVGNPKGVNPFTGVNIEEYYKKLCKSENCEFVSGREDYHYQIITDSADYVDGCIFCGLHDYTKFKNSWLVENYDDRYKFYTLADICSDKSPDWGVLGTNKATEEKLKLFPSKAECQRVCEAVKAKIKEKTGKDVIVCIYGDGAFKDPVGGIWEFADPVTMPGYTDKELIESTPNEVKIKAMIDNTPVKDDPYLGVKEADIEIMKQVSCIHEKDCPMRGQMGTTPRIYRDLLASLMDLTSGSGDRATPVVLIQNYF